MINVLPGSAIWASSNRRLLSPAETVALMRRLREQRVAKLSAELATGRIPPRARLCDAFHRVIDQTATEEDTDSEDDDDDDGQT